MIGEQIAKMNSKIHKAIKNKPQTTFHTLLGVFNILTNFFTQPTHLLNIIMIIEYCL